MKTIFVTSLLLFIGFAAFCQREDLIDFHRIPGINGEPLGKINGIAQDPKGYLWLAGAEQKCVYRYDGVRLIAYRHDNLDDNSLGGIGLESIYADSKGIIWIGLGDWGLDRLDPATGKFTHYPHDPKDPSSLSNNFVSTIIEDRKGQLWIGTGEGLNKLDQATGKFIRYMHDPADPKTLSDNHVQTIYEDRDGVLWIGTGFPWFNVDPEKGGLNRMEADGTFTRFLHDPNNPHTLVSNKVRAVFEDSRGVFWVGTDGDGLHTMDKKNGYVIRYPRDPAHPEKLSRPPRRTDDEFYRINDILTFIQEDRLGGIWIGSMFSGINRYDPETKKVMHIGNGDLMQDDGGWDAFQTSDGTLWIATEGRKPNLQRVEFFDKGIEDVTLGTTVGELREEEDGTIWAGTDLGLQLLDKNKHLVEQYLIDAQHPKHQRNKIICILDQGKDLLLGTAAGIWVFHKELKTFSPFSAKGLNNDEIGHVITMIKDHDGFIWFTTGNKGLARYDQQHGVIKWYRADKTKEGSIGSDEALVVIEAKNSIWVGTTNGGLNRLNRKTDTFTHYLGNAKETSIFMTSDGTLLVGTPTGIYAYDDTSESFSLFGANSIIGIDRTFGITEDDDRNLWVANPNAISKVTADQKEVFTFGRHLGIADLTPGALYKASNGDIWLGHGNGFYVLDPRHFGKELRKLNLLLSDIMVNDVPLNLVDSTKLNNESVDQIELAHDQNNLIFKFSVDDFRAVEASKYFTRMEGYDDVWRESTTEKASHYINIPFGNYTYQVKAYNAFGSKVEKAIRIIIHPPWWRTWWAYTIYAMFAITLGLLARREIVRRERLHAALRLEHMQLEKAKEVDRAKSSLFTNISHEFRTPLTLIKGHAGDMIEEYARFPKTKARLKMIQSSSDQLLRLINQLMDLAKLESGNLVVQRAESDLSMFLNALIGSFSSMVHQRNITMTSHLPSTHYKVLLDCDKVETILINLINNAIKFTPAGGSVTVDASIDQHLQHHQLTISVRDSGVGIAPDHLGKIFERFYQITDVHKEVGTGIGLALVKELTELMQGTIEVKSEIGKGSEFIFTLPVEIITTIDQPVDVGVSEPAMENEILHLQKHQQNGNHEKPKILVVEDNADLIAFISSCLGEEFDFLEAMDGKEGLDLALNEAPDIIISDVMMPEMDGIKMTSRIKTDVRSSHIPVILLTAKAAAENKIEGLTSGAIDYITKPFNKHELVLKVKNAIDGQKRIREKIRLEILREGPTLEVVSADEKFLLKVKETIMNRMNDEQLSVESLAEDIGFSRAQFYRKITALTGMTVNDLIRGLRLQKASQLLSQHWGPVSQVAYEVGFSNLSYFSKCFKEQFGVLPSEYDGSLARSK